MNNSAKESACSGHRERLRSKYERSDIDSWADYEIVEYMLTLIIPRVDVKPTAKNMLSKFGSVSGILDAPIEDLQKIEGIGRSSALAIHFLKDLISVYHRDELKKPGNEISTISKLMRFFKSRIGGLPNEVLEMVCFDAKLRIVPDGAVRLFEGSVNSANVDIRRIVETAIKKGASSIALAHNHPSGDPRPSFEDIRFTRKLSSACKPIDLNFIEQIIVGKNACFSFRRDGRFDDLYDESLEESRIGMRRVSDTKRKIAK